MTITLTDKFFGMLNDLEFDGRYGILDHEDEDGNYVFSTNFNTWVFTYDEIFEKWGEIYG